VKSDATSPSLDRSVSFEIIPAVIQSVDHIADQDADDDEDQRHLWVMSKNSLQLKEPEKFTLAQLDHY